MKTISFAAVLALIVSCAPAAKPGLDIWPHSWLVPFERSAAAPAQVESSLEMRTTPGEYEPAVFALRSDAAVGVEVTVRAGDGPQAIPSGWLEIHRVAAYADTTRPNRLHEFANPVQLDSAVTEFFWITVRPPEGTAAGRYGATVKVERDGFALELPVNCEVLPFELAESPTTGGAFMYLIDLPPGWYADMKRHGLDAIQFFTWEYAVIPTDLMDRSAWRWDPVPIKIRRDGDGLAMDFSVMDEIMGEIEAGGMEGPVVVSLGNDSHLFYEVRIAREFGLKVDTSEAIKGKRIIAPAVSPVLDKLFIEGLRQLRAHWDEMGYTQELIILIYDEPTERLLDRARNRYEMIKQAMPEQRVYGVVMDEREEAEMMLDQMDIIVANGDFTAMKELSEQYAKGYWIYGGMRNLFGIRHSMGLQVWSAGAEGGFFWMYNYWYYNPDNCVVYMHPDDPNQLVRSTFWEAIREGRDDLRYAATAELAVENASGSLHQQGRERLKSILESVTTGRRRGVRDRSALPRGTSLEDYCEYSDGIRARLIDLITDMSVN
ncbi:MAG: hypothetical protein FVQ81_07125 [Candidatus Glassbacteria bacterium]|nr:hypothetical protein [Candidatus Glassbacteria bacterium]